MNDPTLVSRRLRRLSAQHTLPLATLDALYVHDGLLRRLAASPERGIFALHGQPLGRHWRPLCPEPTLPLLARCSPGEVIPHLQALVATPLHDAVRTDPHVIGFEPVDRIDRQSGARVHVMAQFGRTFEATLDLLFAPFEATLADFPGLLSPIQGLPQRSLADELGARIYALVDPHRYHWDAEDLHAVWQLSQLEQISRAAGGAAIRAAMARHSRPLDALDRMRSGAFGQSSSSRRGWRKLGVEVALTVVAEEVGAALERWLGAA
jgi:hypothetical protein